MAPRRSAQAWRQKKQIMLGLAIVFIAIGATGAGSTGGSAEGWIKSSVAVVVAMGLVLLVLRPARWYDKPSR